MKKARKQYTAEEKVAILRRHLLDKEPVSKLCDELALQPTVFYRWQKEFFKNGAAAFQTNNRGRRQPEQERIARAHRAAFSILLRHNELAAGRAAISDLGVSPFGGSLGRCS